MTSIRRLRRGMSAALLLALLAILPTFAQKNTDCTVRVTLLQVNDVYQFTPVEGGKRGGLARVSALRKKIMADSPHKTLAFLVLGLIFIASGTLWCLGVAAFASKAASRIRHSQGVMVWINRVLGGMFVYLGVRVAMLQTR